MTNIVKKALVDMSKFAKQVPYPDYDNNLWKN